MKKLYHGSKEKGLKVLEPRKSTHGEYVYATPYKELAILFSGIAGDDLTYSLFRNSKKDQWQMVERIPDAFSLMFSNSASIYTVSGEFFKDIHTGFSELVCDKLVEVIEEDAIPSVLERIKSLEKSGFIKLYYYPERPIDIPKDDRDLIEKEVSAMRRFGENLNRQTFERLLFLHPNLMDSVNEVARNMDSLFVPYTIQDIKDIYVKFTIKKMLRPEKEMFHSSSRKSILALYPELETLLDEVDSIFKKSKREKIAFVLRAFEVTEEDLESEVNRFYSDDNIEEIVRAIISEFKK